MAQRWKIPLLAAVLSLLFLLNALAPSRSGATLSPLPPDVATHWAVDSIAYIIEAGVMRGYPDGTFRPDAPVSRAEVYTLLARQLRLAVSGTAALPAGWSADHWAAPNGAALIQAGVLVPQEEPLGGNWDAPISRASLARLLVRSQGTISPQRGVNLLIPDIQGRDDAAWISTAVAQGLMTGYPGGSFGPEDSFTRAQTAVVIHRLRVAAMRPAIWSEAYRYALPDGGSVSLQVVRANLRNPRVKPRTLWSPSGVGYTIALGEMASNSAATAAINGTYFSAYNKQPIQDPYGALISGGRFLHLTGSRRPAIGFWPDGTVKIDRFEATISGSINGSTTWPNGWYAYAVNHSGPEYGANWVTIMTPDRGESLGYDAGLSVVVRNGKVVESRQGAVPIPADGYVISLGGAEATNLQKSFRTGSVVDWKVNGIERWAGVSELIQAGPLVLRSGKPDIDFARDDFTEAKITELAWNRSVVGLTADGTLVLVVLDPIRVVDLPPILLDLGMHDALNMDSGASSGLYYRGGYLWEPGRLLTSALGIVVEER